MEQTISNKEVEICSDYFSSQKILPPELYNRHVPIELKSEKTLNGKQYLLAIPITKYFSNLRNLYLLIHILNGDSVISLRLIEYFVVNYVLDNNTYFNIKQYNNNWDYAIKNLYNKKKKSLIEEEICEDILSKQNSSESLLKKELNNFDDLFMIHDNYKCQLKASNKKNFDPFCRWTRIRLYYSAQNFFYTTIAQLNFFKWLIENFIVDYILDNLPIIEKTMIEYEKKIKNDKILRNKKNEADLLEVSENFEDLSIIYLDNNKKDNDTLLGLDSSLLSRNIIENELNTLPNNSLNNNNINGSTNFIVNSNSKLKNYKTKKKELHNLNSEKKTKLKCRKKKEFTKTNRSILRYNCSKLVSFD